MTCGFSEVFIKKGQNRMKKLLSILIVLSIICSIGAFPVIHAESTGTNRYQFDISTVFSWDSKEQTKLSYSENELTVTANSSSIYTQELKENACSFDDYRYLVLKLKNMPEDGHMDIILRGTEWFKESSRIGYSNMKKYVDYGEIYLYYDMDAVKEKITAGGGWQGNYLKQVMITSISAGTYLFTDIYVSKLSPEQECSETPTIAGSSTYDDTLHRLGGYDAGYDPNYVSDDIQDTKYFFKENFTYTNCNERKSVAASESAPDGWDCNISGGSLSGPYYNGNYQLIDTSSTYPVEISRSFEKADHGKVTLEMQLKIDSDMNGTSFSLYGGNYEAIRLETKDEKLYLKHTDKTDDLLFSYIGNKFFGLKIVIDLDANKIDGVYVNGEKKNGNLSLNKSISYIDRFTASTGDNATGTLSFNMVHMYRGYYMNEKFTASMWGIPQEFSETRNASIISWESNPKPDVYSMKLDGSGDKTAYARRSFEKASGKLKFSINLYSDTQLTAKIALTDNQNEAIAINVKDGRIACGDAKTDLKTGIWNLLVLKIDSDAGIAKLYVNYRQVGGDISYNSESIDGLCVETRDGIAVTDDYCLETIYPQPDDYVPAIEKAESDGYSIGMQFCPMWEEGSHSGWDFENSFKEKTPYLGYYDQSSPEAMDWIIKQLAEHGIDFMKVTWCGQPTTAAPVKSAFFGGTFMDAYFNSEYHTQMPFMIMWENVAMNGEAKRLTNNLAPYWIEYYFKNDNYFRINGRPVFQMYSPQAFVSDTEKNGGTKQDCIDAIASFKKMCIDAGVGDPIMVSAGAEQLSEELGFDAVIPYWLGGGTEFTDNAYKWAETTKDMEITTYPVMGSGVTDISKSMTLNPEQFKEQLVELRDKYFGLYDNVGLLGNMLMLETYDEYSEGHWLAPSAMYGFGYFDAVREVFTSNTQHTDTVPTATQRDRFNNLYPAGRVVKRFMPNIKSDGAKDNLSVMYGWYFNGNTTEGWKTDNISDSKVSNGVFKGTVRNGDPYIYIEDLDFNIKDITYVRVKYRNSAASGIQMFFTSNTVAKWNEGGSVRSSVRDDKMQDVYLYAGAIYNFNGRLKSLRLDLGTESGAEFEIDSIELLYDGNIIDKRNIVSRGWYFDKDNDFEGWTAYNVKNLSVNEGKIRGTALTQDPQIFVNNIDLDISDAEYIKINYKTDDNGTGHRLYYTTDTEPNLSEDKSVAFISGSAENQVKYIYMGESKKFTGTLDTLRIDPGDIPEKHFEIDSVEILEKKHTSFTIKITDMNGQEISSPEAGKTVQLTAENTGNTDNSAVLIATLYHNGCPVIVRISDEQAFDTKDNKCASLELKLPEKFDEGTYTLKGFLWSGISQMTPLCDTVSYPK